ncbi:hypothetical protein BLAT2472_80119 [Burkholderia latens]
MIWSPYVRWIRYRDASFAETMSGPRAQVNGCRVPNERSARDPRARAVFDSFSNGLQFICSDKYPRNLTAFE